MIHMVWYLKSRSTDFAMRLEKRKSFQAFAKATDTCKHLILIMLEFFLKTDQPQQVKNTAFSPISQLIMFLNSNAKGPGTRP